MRKNGSGAALAVLFHDVMQNLFLANAIDFAVRIDCKSFSSLPSAEPLSLPRSMLALGGGRMLNTCTSDALVEMLRHLKRSFWPFAWDTSLDPPAGEGVGSRGGFRCVPLSEVFKAEIS